MNLERKIGDKCRRLKPLPKNVRLSKRSRIRPRCQFQYGRLQSFLRGFNMHDPHLFLSNLSSLKDGNICASYFQHLYKDYSVYLRVFFCLFVCFLAVWLKRNMSMHVCLQRANKRPSEISESRYRGRLAWSDRFQTICVIIFSLFLSSCSQVSQGNDEELFPTSQDNFENVFSVHSPIPYSPCNTQFCLGWPERSLDVYWKAA